MKKLSLIAAALAFFLGLTVIASAAATMPRPPGGGGTPTPGCQINCDDGDQATPGEPFFPPGFPEDCMKNCDGETAEIPDPECQINCDVAEIPDPNCQINCGPGQPGGGQPGKPENLASVEACGEDLGNLREVKAWQVNRIAAGELVDIVPICTAKPLGAEQAEVAELRPVIAKNVVLDQELGQEGYEPEHVVGVVVAGDQVTLYVHRT